MHELGIAESALRAVLDVARKANAAHVRRVVVRIGTRSGVEPEAFRFAFNALCASTDARGAELEIECVAATGSCASCGVRFAAEEAVAPTCPACGGMSVKAEGGRELDLVSVDVI